MSTFFTLRAFRNGKCFGDFDLRRSAQRHQQAVGLGSQAASEARIVREANEQQRIPKQALTVYIPSRVSSGSPQASYTSVRPRRGDSVRRERTTLQVSMRNGDDEDHRIKRQDTCEYAQADL
jgi:hypothetical protein